MMTDKQAIEALMGAKLGETTVFVAYEAGRPRTARAEREADRARSEGFNLQHFTGVLTSVRLNKDQEFVFTILTEERDCERTGKKQGYRSFNPKLGGLRTLQVLH